MHSTKSLFFISFIVIALTGFIKADEVKKNSDNNFYIITIKDFSKYSFDIQPSKPEQSKLNKKDEIQKFNSIDFNELEQIINSDDCVSQLNSNDTSICELSKPTKNKVVQFKNTENDSNSNEINSKSNEINGNSINMEELEKQLKPKKSFVNEQMKELAELILDNIDTYDNDNIVNKEIHSLIHKRGTTSINDIINNKAFSKILRKSYSVLDVTVIYAYLSSTLYEIISELPNVVEIVEDAEIKFPHIPEINFNVTEKSQVKESKNKVKRTSQSNQYYNITDIKMDTKWNDVAVDEDTYSHLSLISQSKVDFNLIGKYDTNYYYPSTAGAGVDIYIIDSGINTGHIDFDTKDRTVVCEGIADGDTFIKFSEDDQRRKICYNDKTKNYIYHGTAIASAAAGSYYGVAKKANIHVISMSTTYLSYISALIYIYENAKNPNKTVINISSGSYKYVGVLDKVINMLTRKGFMIFTSSGNDGIDACTTDIKYSFDFGTVNDKYYPASYIDTISVGSIDNILEEKELTRGNYVYETASFSNYGNCIDLYSPGFAYLASIPRSDPEDKVYSDFELRYGTSFSSPIVTGVAALLISEHPEITFNQEIMRKMLVDLSIKDIIGSLNNIGISNNFVNVGKQVVYSSNGEYMGCGIRSGKMSCSNDECCSVDGYCGNTKIYCEVDCQSEYGKCSSNNTISNKDTDINGEQNFKDNYIYNYYNDLCLKFSPDNYITDNIILTTCHQEDEDSRWYISTHGDSQFIEDYYVDVCVNTDESGLVYAYSCDNGTVFKDISTSSSKDAIQSDAFPGKCLKPDINDYNPYGITIFTESKGLHVIMDNCDDEDEYQRWRINNVLPEIEEDEDDAFQKRNKIIFNNKNMIDEPTDLTFDDDEDMEENVTASIEDNEDSESSDDSESSESDDDSESSESEDDSETTSKVDNDNKTYNSKIHEKETSTSKIHGKETITSDVHEEETISIDDDNETPNINDIESIEKETTSIYDEIHEKETSSVDDEIHEKETSSIDDEIHEKETSSIDVKETTSIDEKETSSVDVKETTSIDEKATTSIDEKETSSIDEKETSSIDEKATSSIDVKETTSIDEKATTSIDEKETSSIDEKETSSIDEKEITISESITIYETEYEIITEYPTDYVTGFSMDEEIIYNKFGEVFYRDDYIPCVYCDHRVTNTKSVWIYNEELNLCLTAKEKSKHQARLEPCDSENEYQKWLVPENNEGYYVNKKENDISIIYNQNSLVIDEYIEVIPVEKLYIKNHSSIITYEDEQLKIFDLSLYKDVCFNIQEEEKSKKDEVLIDMIPCEKSSTRWKLTTTFPLTD